jgi:hypothetical protein
VVSQRLALRDRTGDFTAINTPNLSNGLAWDSQWQGDRLSLVVV